MSEQERLPDGGLPPADLGAAFGIAEQRRGRIGGILPSARTTGTTPPAADPVPPATERGAERSAPAERKPDPAPEGRAERTGPAGREPGESGKDGQNADAGLTLAEAHEPAAPAANADEHPPAVGGPDAPSTVPAIFYVPLEMRKRLKHAAVGSSMLDVILDAIEKTESAGILEQLVHAHQAPDSSGLFERQKPRGSEARVKVNVRARPQHLAVLDELAVRYHSNRSELARVALEHVLPGGSRRRR